MKIDELINNKIHQIKTNNELFFIITIHAHHGNCLNRETIIKISKNKIILIRPQKKTYLYIYIYIHTDIMTHNGN